MESMFVAAFLLSLYHVEMVDGSGPVMIDSNVTSCLILTIALNDLCGILAAVNFFLCFPLYLKHFLPTFRWFNASWLYIRIFGMRSTSILIIWSTQHNCDVMRNLCVPPMLNRFEIDTFSPKDIPQIALGHSLWKTPIWFIWRRHSVHDSGICSKIIRIAAL